MQNSILFTESLAEKGVPVELHLYPNGKHGLSLATKEVEECEKGRFADAHVADWFRLCLNLDGEVCLNSLIYMEEREDGCMEQRK